MTSSEALMLLEWLALVDARYGTGGDDAKLAVKAKAWHERMPVELTLQQAQDIATELMGKELTVNPVLIRRRFSELHTPKHRQGLDWAATPAEPEPPKPPAAKPLDSHAARKQVGPGSGGVGAHPVGWDLHNMLNGLGIPRHTEHSAVSVPCPKKGCAAGPWSACVDGQGGTRKQPHQARIDAFDEGNAA